MPKLQLLWQPGGWKTPPQSNSVSRATLLLNSAPFWKSVPVPCRLDVSMLVLLHVPPTLPDITVPADHQLPESASQESRLGSDISSKCAATHYSVCGQRFAS